MACRDCVNFKTPFQQGRLKQSCEQQGEVADGENCPSFTPIEKAHNNFGHDSIFNQIIVDAFNIHKAAQSAVVKIQYQIEQTNGGTVDFDPTQFLTAVEKTVDAYIIHHVLLGTGMGAYLEEVMSHVLADKFSRKETSSFMPRVIPLSQHNKTDNEIPQATDMSAVRRKVDQLIKQPRGKKS